MEALARRQARTQACAAVCAVGRQSAASARPVQRCSVTCEATKSYCTAPEAESMHHTRCPMRCSHAIEIVMAAAVLPGWRHERGTHSRARASQLQRAHSTPMQL